MKTMTRKQAPKGGVTISGVFYAGGQFLPANDFPQHGKYNGKKSKGKKPRKVQIGRYEWDYPPTEDSRSIYALMSGVYAKPDWDNDPKKMVYCGNPQILEEYTDLTEEQAKIRIELYNAGFRWTTDK